MRSALTDRDRWDSVQLGLLLEFMMVRIVLPLRLLAAVLITRIPVPVRLFKATSSIGIGVPLRWFKAASSIGIAVPLRLLAASAGFGIAVLLRMFVAAITCMVLQCTIFAPNALAGDDVLSCRCSTEELEKRLNEGLSNLEKNHKYHSVSAVELLLALADLYARKHDVEKSEAKLQAAEFICNYLPDSSSELKVRIRLIECRDRITSARFGDAVKLADRSMALLDDILKNQTGNDEVRAKLLKSRALSLRGWALAEDQHYAQAAEDYEQSLSLRKSVNAPFDEDSAADLQQVASVYERLGRTSEAENVYLNAIEELARTLGPKHPKVEWCREQLATMYLAQHKYQQAAEALKVVLTDRESTLGPNAPQLVSPLYRYADALQESGNVDAATAVRHRADKLAVELEKKSASGLTKKTKEKK